METETRQPPTVAELLTAEFQELLAIKRGELSERMGLRPRSLIVLSAVISR